jgi:hypothetical protein
MMNFPQENSVMENGSKYTGFDGSGLAFGFGRARKNSNAL